MTPLATDTLVAEKDGPIGYLIVDRTARPNAVSGDMWEAASGLLADFAADSAIRVVVLCRAGGAAFYSDAEEEANRAHDERAHQPLIVMPKPTIAMIRGDCVGRGVSTALCCDLRIASDTSRFALPAARHGLGCGVEGVARLVRQVGPSFAKEILFTARPFTAQEALEMKLVDRVVPESALDDYVSDYAATIAGNAPMTMHAVKVAVLEDGRNPGDRDLDLCERLVDRCNASEDYAEGRRAFMEKRKPVFVGR